MDKLDNYRDEHELQSQRFIIQNVNDHEINNVVESEQQSLVEK